MVDVNEKIKGLIDILPSYKNMRKEDKDLTHLFKDHSTLKHIVNEIKEKYKDEKIDVVVSAEMQGFVLASMIAQELNIGMVPLRKLKRNKSKNTITEQYMQAYGKEELEIHKDALKEGENVLIVDDIIITGQTALAASNLVEKLGGNIIGMAFMIEDDKNKGINKIKNYKTFSVIKHKL